MVLYHGTIMSYANRIMRDGINVYINKGVQLDFGSGFYFSDSETAKRLALRKSKQEVYTDGVDSTPVILALDVDLEALRQTNYLSFSHKTRKWFEFVFTTRRFLVESEYDFIEGPMADGGVDNVVDMYTSHPNILTKLIVWINFMWFEGMGHKQYVVKTPKAVSFVKPIRSKEVCDEQMEKSKRII